LRAFLLLIPVALGRGVWAYKSLLAMLAVGSLA
jgi:hypothetical protein